MTTRLAPSEYLRAYLLGLALEKSYSFLISVVAALAFLPFFILVPFALAGLTSADDSNCIVFLCKDNHQKPGFLRHSHDQESCFRCRVVWIVDDSAQTVAKHGCSFEERNVLLLQIAVSFVGVPLEPESHVVSVPPCLRSSASPTGYLPRLPNDQASAARRCLWRLRVGWMQWLDLLVRLIKDRYSVVELLSQKDTSLWMTNDL